MEFSEIILELEESLAFVTLNRPEKVNSLSEAMVAELSLAFERIGHDQKIKVVLLKANGKHFCAGHLLDEMVEKAPSDYKRIFDNCAVMMRSISKLPQPVIGLVQGVATAAGCQLAASCDLVIAAENTRFATPGVKIGLFCSTPAVPLVRAVGRKRALEMLLTGQFVKAKQALEWGLVNRIVPLDDLEEQGRKLAGQIAKASGLTLAMGKKTFNDQFERSEDEAYNLATNVMALNLAMEDAQEGIKAFLEKREPPVWKSR